jgi:hypothetical protein
MVVALAALVVALEGPAIAHQTAHIARLINGAKIKPGTVTTKQIKNHTVKKIDLAPAVLGDVFTMAQSDSRYVNKVQGTQDEAPNSAALGGKLANAFYDKNESDARFVNKVPGTTNQAPNSAQLEGHPASDFARVGTDVTGSINLTAGAIAAHSCLTTENDLTGARLGDLPVMAFVGDTPAPQGLVFEPIKINAPDHMTMRICNPTNSASPAGTNVGVRVLAFR